MNDVDIFTTFLQFEENKQFRLFSQQGRTPLYRIVSVKLPIFPYEHVGIAFPNGSSPSDWPVIHNSVRTNGPIRETLGEFARGRVVKAGPLRMDQTMESVMDRFIQRTKHKYDLLEHNCEHFVCEMLGEMPQSPQLQATVFGFGCWLLESVFSTSRKSKIT